MTDYRIVCTTQEPPDRPHDDAHITAVGTGIEANRKTRTWTVHEVYEAMSNKDRFFTKGEQSDKVAWVRKWSCRSCRFDTLKSEPDAVLDNNLDNLPPCIG